MKTVLLTLEYPPFKGGVANYYSNLVKSWPDKEGLKVIDNKHNKLLNKFYIISWLAAWVTLIKFLKKNKEANVLIGQVLPLGTVAYLEYLRKKIKYSIFIHGMDFNFAFKYKRKRYLMFLSFSKADKIICANSYVASLIINWKEEFKEKITIINPGIDEATCVVNNNVAYLRKKYQTEDKITLLTLGRLVSRKGVDDAILALDKIDKNISKQIKYLVAGKGPDEIYLKKIAANTDLDISFLGEISDNEKWSLLDLCDIFIMPTKKIAGDFEGFGIVYLEANLFSKPVIATDVGGVSDAVVNDENGLLIPANNQDLLIKAILELIRDKEKRLLLGQKGRERAIAKFNWAQQTNNLYQNIL